MVEDTQKRYADDITLQELVRLRVENERLREALKAIATGDGVYGRQAYEYKEIARSALQQKETE